MITELDYSALKRHTNIEDLGDEVKALDDNSLIGQSTGEEALKFGLNVKAKATIFMLPEQMEVVKLHLLKNLPEKWQPKKNS